MYKLRNWNINKYIYKNKIRLTLEALRGGGGGGGHSGSPPQGFLALNFCCLTDWQKLWCHCSMLVNTSFDANKVTSQPMTSS